MGKPTFPRLATIHLELEVLGKCLLNPMVNALWLPAVMSAWFAKNAWLPVCPFVAVTMRLAPFEREEIVKLVICSSACCEPMLGNAIATIELAESSNGLLTLTTLRFSRQCSRRLSRR